MDHGRMRGFFFGRAEKLSYCLRHLGVVVTLAVFLYCTLLIQECADTTPCGVSIMRYVRIFFTCCGTPPVIQ